MPAGVVGSVSPAWRGSTLSKIASATSATMDANIGNSYYTLSINKDRRCYLCNYKQRSELSIQLYLPFLGAFPGGQPASPLVTLVQLSPITQSATLMTNGDNPR